MKYPLIEFKEDIIKKLELSLKNLGYLCKVKLENPPEELGDFAFPCFQLAPIAKKSPNEIALDIKKNIKKCDFISKIEVKAGYVNFFIDEKELSKKTLYAIFSKKEKYGYLEKRNKKVIIEHTSANPNGPLHVGRARNPIIGDTLVRIYKASGYNVESQFYLDDMGKQVAILCWGINNLDSKDILKSNFKKSDHKKVGYYQLANELMQKNNDINAQINNIIKKLEHGDEKTIDLIHDSYKPVLEGINQSLHKINIEIDKYIPESKFVKDKSVNEVVAKLKNSEFCKQEDGAFYLDLESFGIKGRSTKFFFLRKDGTTLYATRDIAYHLWKAKQADLLINILGEDHKLESKQVEISLKLTESKILPRAVFYSFVSLPGGKMSTRRGRVVYLDELIKEISDRAYEEVKNRRGKELSEEQMKNIANIVGIGALRYNIIKVQPEKDIVFKWDEALNFEGNSAPFIQYAYARACGIIKKMGKNEGNEYDYLDHESEKSLIKQLSKLPLVIEESCESFKPHIIANFLYDTASKFNQFYRDCPVNTEKNVNIKNSRLALVRAAKIVFENALNLIGIQAPEEM